MAVLDQDCDGNKDIVLYHSEDSDSGSVSVLYGTAGNNLPDTTNLKTVHFRRPLGSYAQFLDLTGDGVPELAICYGIEQIVRIYAGKSGQRIDEQYGSGDDPADPNHGRPWARPWAEVWLPYKLNDAWPGVPFQPLADLGDANLDGVADLWTYAHPFLMGYVGGHALDSMIDVLFDDRIWGGQVLSMARLGDIDGSGMPTVALGCSAGTGTVIFTKLGDSVPSTGDYRELPHPEGYHCAPASGVDTPLHPRDAEHALRLTAVPNPSHGEVDLQWDAAGTGPATLLLADASGREVRHVQLPASDTHATFATAGLPAGVYVVRLTIGSRSALAKIIVQ